MFVLLLLLLLLIVIITITSGRGAARARRRRVSQPYSDAAGRLPMDPKCIRRSSYTSIRRSSYRRSIY